MKLIKLSKGKVTMVDNEDYIRLIKQKWHAHSNNGRKFYAIGQINGKKIKLHRLLTNCPTGKEVDHIDGNSLNNQKHNLKICSSIENKRNNKGHYYKKLPVGIYYHKTQKMYQVSKQIDKKQHYFGTYKTLKDAKEKLKIYEKTIRTNKKANS